MTDRACLRCEAFHPAPQLPYGQCRRYAPRGLSRPIIPPEQKTWPIVWQSDWCLEFSRREGPLPEPQPLPEIIPPVPEPSTTSPPPGTDAPDPAPASPPPPPTAGNSGTTPADPAAKPPTKAKK